MAWMGVEPTKHYLLRIAAFPVCLPRRIHKLMSTFRQFLNESLSPETIKFWSNYAKTRIFATEEQARDWLFYQLERSDHQPHSAMFGINGPEKNRSIATEMPLWQSGKSWKIGKRVRGPDNRLRLKDLEIKHPGLQKLVVIAQSNTEYDFEFTKVQPFSIKALLPEQDRYLTNPGEIARIQNLAYSIKTHRWFEPVVVGVAGKDLELWEGQHRTRALKLLGFNMVPGIGVVMQSPNGEF